MLPYARPFCPLGSPCLVGTAAAERGHPGPGAWTAGLFTCPERQRRFGLDLTLLDSFRGGVIPVPAKITLPCKPIVDRELQG